jgi:hypothetical protein
MIRPVTRRHALAPRSSRTRTPSWAANSYLGLPLRDSRPSRHSSDRDDPAGRTWLRQAICDDAAA